ncbi:hypothetical protein FAF44_42340 [Nonomuraea sp. MG754425]|uniref:hypothetical protein n=1 Tax=Nonomuraea sp. MG754425 TaxID=2570319 RepID=UPI001F1A79C4|nr:hypothetical protein [Nonomuraea sp. MG754425]MCF6474967.1 hypothetical protein [Nonomuraea sp. MG754425]
MTLDELRATYNNAWEISTEPVAYVFAWRRVPLTPNQLGATSVNVLHAWDLDELTEKLEEQETPK